MSQYESRIAIKVSSPKVWEKFKEEDDASLELYSLSNTNTQFYESDCCYLEDELYGIVEAISKTLGDEGIIISDTTNINVDPYNYCVLYLGDKVRGEYFDCDCKKRNMFFNTLISDIPEWLSYGSFSINEKEKEQLYKCGILVVKEKNKTTFQEFVFNLELPERILLRETGTKSRIETIESLSIGNSISLKHSPNAENNLLVEALYDDESIGFLPSEVGDSIAPLLITNKLDYIANIVEVTPLSKRNKHATSPIVRINIKASMK